MAIAYDPNGFVIGDIPEPYTENQSKAETARLAAAAAAKKKKSKPVVATTSASAKPGNANDVSTVGLPSQSPQTRGDVSGSIATTNKNLKSEN